MELLVPILITLIVVVVFALVVLSLIGKLVSGTTKNTSGRSRARKDPDRSDRSAGAWYDSDYGAGNSAVGSSESSFGGGGDFGGGGAGGSFEDQDSGDVGFDAGESSTDFDAGGGDSGDSGGGDSGNGGSGE